MTDLPFAIGKTYHRIEDIHDEYGGNRYSGISPSSKYPLVFIFYGKSGEWHGYDDEFLEDGTFLYTGEGRDGDMTMDSGNAAIREHANNGDELHVFEIEEGAWQVTYVGEYEYDDHHWTRLPDRNGRMRDAIRFELVPAGGREIDIEAARIEDLTEEELYQKAEASVTGAGEARSEVSSRTVYRRSDVVKAYARKVANGVCRGCETDAPFIDTNGEPYLEVHHLYRRSDGGADHPDNVIALCPNCHSRVHNGQDGENFNQTLIEKVQSRPSRS